MESKNIKIIDEHNIDRDANIVSAFSIDNNNYVFYWIERDEDNVNLFVSKLLKNNDNTSNMMNIEDSMEKSRVSDVIKELVTSAVKSEADKATNEMTLNDGTKVVFNQVMFNREQSINVTKTYVSTVKKAVVKATEKFYDITPVEEKTEAQVNDAIFLDVPEPAPVVPVEAAAAAVETAAAVVTTPEPTMGPVLEMPEVIPESVPEPAPVAQENNSTEEIMNSFADNINAPVDNTTVNNEVKAEPVVPEPILPVAAEPVKEPVAKVEEKPAEVQNAAFTFVTPVPEPVVAPAENVTPEPVQPVVSAPIVPETPVIPAANPVLDSQPVAEMSEAPQLVFDGSQETNLNTALGNDGAAVNVVPTSDVSALRSFGESDAQPSAVVAPTPAVAAEQPVASVSKTRGGFANFKVIAIIGLIVFVAACAFMGYEIFNYINAVK